MKAKIYHVKQPTFFPDNSLKLEDFDLVAEIDTNDVDKAYALSQNINDLWTTHEGVTPLKGLKLRSTSVGDIIEIDGMYNRCEMMGWATVIF
jgi:hypothetical protein